MPRLVTALVTPLATRLAFSLSVTALAAVTGCRAPPPPPVTIAVVVHGDRGNPTPGAEIYSGSALVTKTSSDGRARLDVNGAEGDTFDLTVRCPPGYASPTQPLHVRRFAVGAGKAPEYVVTCHETRRSVVVVVRADNGPNLPVLYLGKEVARTDISGAAHVLLDADVRDRVELSLGTAGKDTEKLHPQNPSQVFDVGNRDTLQVFAVVFTRDKKKAPVAHGGPKGPTRF